MHKTNIKNNEIEKIFNLKYKAIQRDFLKSGQPVAATSKLFSNYTDLIDKIIKKLSAQNTALAVIATGGYGRRELAPRSDIDILFLSAQPLTAQNKKYIESIIQQFWTMGLKISASQRSIQECEKDMSEDIIFLTGLLEMRLVCGDKSIYKKFQHSFRQFLHTTPPSAFISAKLEERDGRHIKMGDSRYHLEPNVKESKGALRDIHILLWITNFLYSAKTPEALTKKKILTKAEAKTLQQALHFFWTVRCHLHLISERAVDRLSFEIQPLIAERMGYTDAAPNVRAESFMKDYFLMAKEIGHLTRLICAELEENSLGGGATAGTKKLALQDRLEGFPVKNNRLTITDADYFKKNPSDIIRIFHSCQKTGHDIHPEALRAIRKNIAGFAPLLQQSPEAHQIFLDILLEPKKAETILRRMNEADVLGALIPPFKNIIAHMQYDMYHVYTADEHTLRAVGILHQIENGGKAEAAVFATALFEKIHSRRALYAAMFLHDIAKGMAGKHADKGAGIAKKLCPQLGLTPEETETVAWLVQEHLLMTLTAFKRDLNDAKTIADFTAQVQSIERLKLLTILTTADIMAVGPDRWNNWKSGLLTELYQKTFDAMSGIDIFQTTLPLDQSEYKENATLIKITPYPDHDYTEVFIAVPDKKGLFATLAGALSASGASIVEAKIFTRSDGMAIDVFNIQNLNGHAYDNSAFLHKTLKSALAGKLDLQEEIQTRQKIASRKNRYFKIESRVIIDNNASASATLIEVNGKDRQGFLYTIARALTTLGLQVTAAKITTFGSKAVDVFYVRDGFGLKITHPDRISEIETVLKQTLEENL